MPTNAVCNVSRAFGDLESGLIFQLTGTAKVSFIFTCLLMFGVVRTCPGRVTKRMDAVLVCTRCVSPQSDYVVSDDLQYSRRSVSGLVMLSTPSL